MAEFTNSASAPADPPRVMTLRYAGVCRMCHVDIEPGTLAQWDQDLRGVTCLSCVESGGQQAPSLDSQTDEAPASPLFDWPGSSAAIVEDDEEDHAAPSDAVTRDRRPRLGGATGFPTNEPTSPAGRAPGAEGERQVARILESLRSDTLIALHDRRIPGSRGTVGHVVVGTTGIYLVDSMRLRGRVEQRSTGSLFHPGPPALFVGDEDQAELIEAKGRQLDSISSAFDGVVGHDVPVRSVLCYIGVDWGRLVNPITVGPVTVTHPKGLEVQLREPGPIAPDQIAKLTAQIERLLPRA